MTAIKNWLYGNSITYFYIGYTGANFGYNSGKLKSKYKGHFSRIHKYLALVKNLGIKSSIAERSYVTDFARVANANGKTDTKSCKQVIVEKIKLLSPKLVVPIGAEPRDAFSREISTVPNKYSSVPFSLNGVPDKTKQEGPVQYKKVPERINDLLFLH
ncbi:hypothetical protein NST17_09890 [Caldifermentibacillus hisashii]|uniref:Uracil-DNA glycosylase-like domain-containing protein n=1 Tax=Caldifermentibacillus hisashii TaxID=996558 RepID=A0ABU9JXC1_9BACI|nr:hypothetical protein [Caldibacillus thermoamylovorans]MCM3055718.1 hypothetical protein [Caldibacillus thermoamylovorans]